MSDRTKPDELSTTEDETTNLLESFTDLVSTLTLPARVIRNASKAIGRLCSAVIDVPTGALERRSAEKQAESEARIHITEESAAQITRQMNVPVEYAQRAGNKFAEKSIREQINLDRVSAAAINELQRSESDGSTDQITDSNKEKTISDDFLNSFEEEARQKSSEEMQLLFGRILAGEIKNPGTYSTRTVKLLAQLDRYVALQFKWLCSRCVVWGDPAAGFLYDARVPSLGGNANGNTLAGHGIIFDDLNILNEHGLIISEYHSSHTYNWSILGEMSPPPMPFWYQGRYWALFPLEGWDQNQEQFRLWGIALSQVGRELFRVVDQDPAPRFTEDLKEFFVKQHLRMVEVDKYDNPWKELPTETSGSVE